MTGFFERTLPGLLLASRANEQVFDADVQRVRETEDHGRTDAAAAGLVFLDLLLADTQPFGEFGQRHVQVLSAFADVPPDLLVNLCRRSGIVPGRGLSLSGHASHLFLTEVLHTS